MKKDKSIIYWLATGCVLIFLMVVIGGITRLTGSGLSITEWKVVTGTIPPMNEQQWQEEFEKYKLIPQFKLINSNFELSDFKKIYFWEYVHRLIGRLIGIVFIVPFFYFWLKKRISKELMPRLIIMFLLGALQGVIGWYMVSSGLSENIHVSHLRLALHLGTAFFTFGYIYYVFLAENSPSFGSASNSLSRTFRTGITPLKSNSSTLPLIFLVLVFIQILMGALVAGTRAGFIYNTWPGMEGQLIPDAVPFAFNKEGLGSLINNMVTVQFIHRQLAFVICIAALAWWYFQKNKLERKDSRLRSVNLLLAVVVMQIMIGIFTLLSGVPVWLGVLHQSMAFVLFAAAIYQWFNFRYRSL